MSIARRADGGKKGCYKKAPTRNLL